MHVISKRPAVARLIDQYILPLTFPSASSSLSPSSTFSSSATETKTARNRSASKGSKSFEHLPRSDQEVKTAESASSKRQAIRSSIKQDADVGAAREGQSKSLEHSGHISVSSSDEDEDETVKKSGEDEVKQGQKEEQEKQEQAEKVKICSDADIEEEKLFNRMYPRLLYFLPGRQLA